MKNVILAGFVLIAGAACQGTTAIGGADGGCAVTIPRDGFLGPNILYPGNESLQAQPAAQLQLYELVASHDATATVRVNMTLLSGNPWVISDSANDWHVMPFGTGANTQMFEAPNAAGEFEEGIYFLYSGQARVELFECGATTPAVSKIISWSPPDGGGPPDDGGPWFPPDGGTGFPPDGGPGFPPDGGPWTPLDGGPWTPLDGGPWTPLDGGYATDGPVILLDGGYATDGGPVANPHGG